MLLVEHLKIDDEAFGELEYSKLLLICVVLNPYYIS